MGLFQISHSKANFEQHRFPTVKFIKEIDKLHSAGPTKTNNTVKN